MTGTPITFEDRRDGRTAAMLGAVEIGSIIPIQGTNVRAAYVFALPPHVPMRYVRSTDEAKRKLIREIEQWLQAAGLE